MKTDPIGGRSRGNPTAESRDSAYPRLIEPRTRGPAPLARVLGSLASAILDLGLPAIRSWLTSRVGPGADVGAVRSDGARVHLTDVVIPLGRAGRITLDRAAVVIVGGRKNKKRRIRLDAFAGKLALDDGSLRAEVRFAADEQPAPDTWACGRLVIDRVGWTPLTERDPRASLRGEAHLTITSESWSVDDCALEGPVASASLVGHGELDGAGEQEVELRVKDVDAEMLAAIVTAMGLGDAPFHIPVRTHARGSGRVTSRGGALTAEGAFELSSEASSVRVDPIRFEAGALDGTKIAATLTSDDARIIGLFPGKVRLASGAVARAELDVSGPARAPTAEGRVSSEGLTLVRVDEDGTELDRSLALLRVSAGVRVDAARFVYEGLSFVAYGGSFRGRGELGLGEESDAPVLELDVAGARPDLAPALSRFFGGPDTLVVAHEGPRGEGEIFLPRDARIEGMLSVTPAFTLTARVRVETEGSDLVFCYATEPGRDRIDGKISVSDLATALPAGLPFAWRSDDVIDLELAILRGAGGLAVGGGARARALFVHPRGGPPLSLHDVSAELYADGDGVAWRHLNARLQGGWVASLGAAGRGALSAEVTVTDVDVAGLTLEGRPLGEWASGLLGGELVLTRHASTGAMVGEGALSLRRGAYPALLRLGPFLARYGLPHPELAAAGDATLRFVLAPDHLSVIDATVRLTGATVRGGVTFGFDRTVRGRLDVRIEDAYLRKSTLFVLPAVLAEEIHVPVSLRGTLDTPRVEADLVSTVGRFIERNRLTELFDEAVDDVLSLVTGKRKADEAPAPPSDPPAAEPLGVAPSRDDLRATIDARADWARVASALRTPKR